MEQVLVERLDHLGLIASVIEDVRLIDMIDTRLVPDAQERIAPGKAVAGMILKGLGFANRPSSLTPQFFANKPLALLFCDGIDAEMFNRFTLGRTLDEAYAYGGDLVLEELALAVPSRCRRLEKPMRPHPDPPAQTSRNRAKPRHASLRTATAGRRYVLGKPPALRASSGRRRHAPTAFSGVEIRKGRR